MSTNTTINAWNTYLQTLGATFDVNGNTVFTSVADEIKQSETRNCVSNLENLGVIHVTGEEASSFLQNQLSNDIQALTNNSSKKAQLSSYCNPKGRILALFYVVPAETNDDGYYLVTIKSLIEATLKRLQMFVLMSKVSLKDISEDIHCIGLSIAGDTQQTNIDLPKSDYSIINNDGQPYIKIPGKDNDRYLILATEAQSTWQQLSENTCMSGSSVWHWLDIKAGIPSIWQQTQSEFVPQMVNLDIIDGVSFKKGCYPGQEIVARMHYLGKAKRRMFQFSLDTAVDIEVGSDIYNANEDKQSVGKIVLAQQNGDKTILLAVIQLAKLSASSLHLNDQDGPALTMEELPYSLEDEVQANDKKD